MSQLKKQQLDTWEKLANELHQPIKRNFPKRRGIAHNVDDIWCSAKAEQMEQRLQISFDGLRRFQQIRLDNTSENQNWFRRYG